MAGEEDVVLSVGADTSPAQAAFAELVSYGEKVQSDLGSKFAQGIAVGGLVTFFTSIIEKAHEIHRESERFGIDSDQLQRIGNAAKLVGIDMTTVAKAMNFTEISAYKATQGEKAQA